MPKPLQTQLKNLPKSPGIYKFLDDKKNVLYVGKAKNLRSRVGSYFNKTTELSLAKQDMMMRVAGIQTITAKTEDEALVLEALNIKKYKPPYNVVLKDDKDYSFVKIDLNQEYPTVAIVRRPKIENKKQKLFGPFTSGYALQENLRFLRRIFPFRKHPKAPSKFEKDLLEKRSIGAVPASRAEYLDMIKRLIKIIDGRTNAVQSDLKKKMLALSKQKNYEEAAKTRNQMHWLDIFKTRQRIISAKEYLESTMPKIEIADNALSDLQDTLKLTRIPRRIEGYDISNIQGQFAVGSMVVFTDAKPEKKEYRKFKIKTIKGANDFASLAEVLKRRFKHDEWQNPDLVLIDGGKGQLSVIINALYSMRHPELDSGSDPKKKKQMLKQVQHDDLDTNQFIALAKKQEDLYQGKTLKKINLDPKSPASHLLQQIRDEAHRFAQKYYHTLHSKSLK